MGNMQLLLPFYYVQILKDRTHKERLRERILIEQERILEKQERIEDEEIKWWSFNDYNHWGEFTEPTLLHAPWENWSFNEKTGRWYDELSSEQLRRAERRGSKLRRAVRRAGLRWNEWVELRQAEAQSKFS